MQLSRNKTVDALRFIFTLLVVMVHYPAYYHLPVTIPIHGWYSVEFFFIVSGFLMVQSGEKYVHTPVWKATFQFMKKKISHVAPVWMIVLTIFTLDYLITGFFGITHLFQSLASVFPSYVFLSSIGLKEMVCIPYSWYITTMLLAMLILFPLYLRFKKVFLYIIAPLVVVFSSVFMLQRYNLIIPLDNEWLLICYPEMIRGISDLCVGCMAYELCRALKTRYDNRLTPLGRTFFSLVGTFFFLTAMFFILYGMTTTTQFFTLISLGLCVAFAFADLGYSKKLFRSPVVTWLGQISLSLYLSQGLSQKYLPNLPRIFGPRVGMLVYLLANFIIAVSIYYLGKGLQKLFRLLKVKMVRVLTLQDSTTTP